MENQNNNNPEHEDSLKDIEARHTENPNKPHKPIEQDYAKHESDPGPAPEAVKEYNENGAGPVMKWLIPVLVVILLVYWFVFRH